MWRARFIVVVACACCQLDADPQRAAARDAGAPTADAALDAAVGPAGDDSGPPVGERDSGADERCTVSGAGCERSSDCCSRLCGGEPRQCQPLDCGVAEDGCNTDSSCCSLDCAADGRCHVRRGSCVMIGELCDGPGDCCSGRCDGVPSRCRDLGGSCSVSGELCDESGDCCSGVCTERQCERRECGDDGDRCGAGEPCCDPLLCDEYRCARPGDWDGPGDDDDDDG